MVAVIYRDVLIADLRYETNNGYQKPLRTGREPVERRVIADWRGKSHAEAVRFAVWLADGWFEHAREQWVATKALASLADPKAVPNREEMVEALK